MPKLTFIRIWSFNHGNGGKHQDSRVLLQKTRYNIRPVSVLFTSRLVRQMISTSLMLFIVKEISFASAAREIWNDNHSRQPAIFSRGIDIIIKLRIPSDTSASSEIVKWVIGPNSIRCSEYYFLIDDRRYKFVVLGQGCDFDDCYYRE